MIKHIIAAGAMLATIALMMQAQTMTPDEQKGIVAIQNAAKGGVDAMAAAVDDFVAKYPKSPAAAYALNATADQYEARGNSDKGRAYYQRTLEVDPRNYYAMLMVATEIARSAKEFPLDQAKQDAELAKAEKYVNDGLSILATAPKPSPDTNDQDWANLKKEDEARGHEALGMIAMARKKYDVAVTEFKRASEGGSGQQVVAMIRLAGAYNQEKKYTESIAVLDKVLAIKDLPEAYKTIATNLEKAAADARDKK